MARRALVSLLLATVCFAQTGLTSANWRERAAAFHALVQGTLTTQDEQRIVGLLERENQVVATALAATGGTRGVSSTIGEDYSEYYSSVLAKAADFVRGGSDSAIAVVSRGAYNEDSSVGNILVEKWRTTLPLFIQSAGQTGLKQARSLRMVGRILALHRSEIPTGQLDLAESRMVAALSSSSTNVRIAAIRANAEGGSTKGLEIIKRLAAQDKAQSNTGKQVRFPVREEAARAITQLQR